MPTRKAEAEWKGDLKSGKGNIKVESGAFEGAYSFQTRFEEGSGTNPEELIGAAHAGCYSMALSAGLADAGHEPKSVQTNADVSLEKEGDGFAIKSITLNCTADIPGISNDEFQKFAEDAKNGCPVSQALAGVTINLNAGLK